MTTTTRVVSVLAGLAAAAVVSLAVPAVASADNNPGSRVPPCGVTGAYAWQDTCDPVAGGPGGDH